MQTDITLEDSRALSHILVTKLKDITVDNVLSSANILETVTQVKPELAEESLEKTRNLLNEIFPDYKQSWEGDITDVAFGFLLGSMTVSGLLGNNISKYGKSTEQGVLFRVD